MAIRWLFQLNEVSDQIVTHPCQRLGRARSIYAVSGGMVCRRMLTLFASTVLETGVLGALVLPATAIALYLPDVGERFLGRIEKLASKLALRRLLCCGLLAAAVLLIRVELLPIWHIPRPRIHDEFGYLFSAATFADGRLTNPSPTYCRFFEAPHILVTPTFQSRYPPGQGMVLAAGKVLLGNPWFGVLLSCAAMAAAICWMLQGWMPARWALLGGLLSLVRLSIYSYWMNSYWGGAVAAVGGCLVMGAYPRIVRRGRFGYAWAMGAGLLILANTRPLEGVITSLPIGMALLQWLWTSQKASLRARIVRVIGPLALCAVVGAVFTGYYNYRVTGNALRMPHTEFARQYAHVPMLLMGRLDDRKIVYLNADMEYQYAVWERAVTENAKDHYLGNRAIFLEMDDHDTLGILLAIPLFTIAWTRRDRRIRLMLVCLLIMALLMLVEGSGSLHYAAPQIGSFFGLLVQCFRHLRAGRRGKPRRAGRFLSRALPVASVICFIAFGVSRGKETGWTETLTPVQQRPEAEATLVSASKGKAVVFVRYQFEPGMTEPFEDWNYNSPDLDTAPVLWVHDMGRNEDDRFLRAYPGRVPWIFVADYSNGILSGVDFSPYKQISAH
jgi:hypothetical protein